MAICRIHLSNVPKCVYLPDGWTTRSHVLRGRVSHDLRNRCETVRCDLWNRCDLLNRCDLGNRWETVGCVLWNRRETVRCDLCNRWNRWETVRCDLCNRCETVRSFSAQNVRKSLCHKGFQAVVQLTRCCPRGQNQSSPSIYIRHICILSNHIRRGYP